MKPHNSQWLTTSKDRESKVYKDKHVKLMLELMSDKQSRKQKARASYRTHGCSK